LLRWLWPAVQRRKRPLLRKPLRLPRLLKLLLPKLLLPPKRLLPRLLPKLLLLLPKLRLRRSKVSVAMLGPLAA
jgi:hypothetical protein